MCTPLPNPSPSPNPRPNQVRTESGKEGDERMGFAVKSRNAVHSSAYLVRARAKG